MPANEPPTSPADLTVAAAPPPARPLAWVAGRVLPASEASVPVLDDGFLRGDAVFEGILVRGGRTHAVEDHLARLRASGRATGIRIPVVTGAIRDLLAAWGERDGALKLVVTRGGNVVGLLTEPRWPNALDLVTLDIPWRNALSGVKTLSYAVNQWASRQARAREADDALVVTDGVVQELPNAAIVWSSGGVLRSPDPELEPILASVTLRRLQHVADVELGSHRLDEVLAADEVFVVSATRPVLPVRSIDDHEFPAPGEHTARLRDLLDEHITATLDPRP